MSGHSVRTRKDELDRGDNEICRKDEGFLEGDPKFVGGDPVLSDVSIGTGSSLALDGEDSWLDKGLLRPEMGSGSDRRVAAVAVKV